MDTPLINYYYDRCDPARSVLRPEDGFVDFDAPDATGARARGRLWGDVLAAPFERSSHPAFVLLSGLLGCGKTTELARLIVRLSRREGSGAANLLPVNINAEQMLDIRSPIEVPDLWLSILHAAHEAVRAAEGPLAPANERPPARRLWEGHIQPELGGAALAPDARVFERLRDDASLRVRAQQVVAQRLTAFLEEARRELRAIERRAVALGYRGVVVVVDSLEKMRGVGPNWERVLDSAARMFSGGAPFLRLPVHAVFTVPPSMLLRLPEDVVFLPMLRVREREGGLCGVGRRVARELIRQRVPDDHLTVMLGEATPARIDQLIDASGGYPRDIVRMLRHVVSLYSGAPLDDESFATILADNRSNYRRLLTDDAVPWLARLSVTKTLLPETSQHLPTVDRLLRNNLVLRYVNHEEWFDIHPALREHPSVAAAIEALHRAAV